MAAQRHHREGTNRLREHARIVQRPSRSRRAIDAGQRAAEQTPNGTQHRQHHGDPHRMVVERRLPAQLKQQAHRIPIERCDAAERDVEVVGREQTRARPAPAAARA